MMDQEKEENIHKGIDVNRLTESLVKAFFYNNSRLINTANEEINNAEKYGSLYSKTIELKDGIVSVSNGTYYIYGYCLGASVEFSGYVNNKNYYDLKIGNIPPLFGYVDMNYFTLNAYIGILVSDNNINVKFADNHTLNYLQGSKELFEKWLNRALDKRFPMSKVKNPISRFLY